MAHVVERVTGKHRLTCKRTIVPLAPVCGGVNPIPPCANEHDWRANRIGSASSEREVELLYTLRRGWGLTASKLVSLSFPLTSTVYRVG